MTDQQPIDHDAAIKAADDLVAAGLIYEDEALLKDAQTVQAALRTLVAELANTRRHWAAQFEKLSAETKTLDDERTEAIRHLVAERDRLEEAEGMREALEVVEEWLSLVDTFTAHNYARVRHVPICQGEIDAIRSLAALQSGTGRMEP